MFKGARRKRERERVCVHEGRKTLAPLGIQHSQQSGVMSLVGADGRERESERGTVCDALAHLPYVLRRVILCALLQHTEEGTAEEDAAQSKHAVNELRPAAAWK
jgi:hypothetical protein